jgi:hypothetical protein
LTILTATIKRKEIVDFKQLFGKPKQFVCVCIATTKTTKTGVNNEKISSNKAIIRSSCKF